MVEEEKKELTDEEVLVKMALAMKDNASPPDDKHSAYTFLNNIALAPDTTKTGNLQVDKDTNELGVPAYNVRGAKEMALISKKIMDNEFFEDYFKQHAEDTLATSLSREGFLVRQATTQTKQVADVTRRRKINKGWFGSKKVDESGGDTTST